MLGRAVSLFARLHGAGITIAPMTPTLIQRIALLLHLAFLAAPFLKVAFAAGCRRGWGGRAGAASGDWPRLLSVWRGALTVWMAGSVAVAMLHYQGVDHLQLVRR